MLCSLFSILLRFGKAQPIRQNPWGHRYLRLHHGPLSAARLVLNHLILKAYLSGQGDESPFDVPCRRQKYKKNRNTTKKESKNQHAKCTKAKGKTKAPKILGVSIHPSQLGMLDGSG